MTLQVTHHRILGEVINLGSCSWWPGDVCLCGITESLFQRDSSNEGERT